MANEKTYLLTMETAEGYQIHLAEKVTLQQASFIVDGLDARFENFDGETDLPDTDPLAHYEGCNVMAHNEDGILLYTGEQPDGWEAIEI